MRKVEGYPNYDESTFSDPIPVAPNDEAILNVVKQQHKLSEFIDPKNFKSYEELKRKLDEVLSGAAYTQTASELAESAPPSFASAPAPTFKAEQPSWEGNRTVTTSTSEPSLGEDDGFDLSYFQKIANE